MKKILALFVVLSFGFAIAGCPKEDPKKVDETNKPKEETKKPEEPKKPDAPK